METTCEFCLTKCITKEYYKIHQKVKLCKKYKDVSFTCLKCSFTTVGIRNIESHMSLCKFPRQPGKKQSDNNASLLTIERVKNKIYKQLIEQNTSIKLDDFIDERDHGLHIYNVTNGIVPIITHQGSKFENLTIQTPCDTPANTIVIPEIVIKPPVVKPVKQVVKPVKQVVKQVVKPVLQVEVVSSVSETKSPEVSPEKSPETSPKTTAKKTLSKTYRTVKNCINLFDEPSDKMFNDHIKAIDEETMTYINMDASKIVFEKCIGNIQESRIYTKSLEKMKNARTKLLPGMSLNEYCDLVNSHIQIFKEIFEKKKYSPRKITNVTIKGLTAIEMRLLHYGNYTTSHLEVDNLQYFDECLTSSMLTPKCYYPFVHSDFYQQFQNYGSVLFPVKQNIKRYLLNKYEFFNVVYLPIPQSTDNDPFSFYILENIKKGNRCWKMDCRLGELSNGFRTTMLEFFISIFRKLYCDVFHDNEYRSDYKGKSQVTEYDCEQLLQNIIFVNNSYDFTKILQQIVIENCTCKPTVKDRFDFRGDDKLQKRKFIMSSKKSTDVVDIIKRLFDDISSEEAVDFYRDVSS